MSNSLIKGFTAATTEFKERVTTDVAQTLAHWDEYDDEVLPLGPQALLHHGVMQNRALWEAQFQNVWRLGHVVAHRAGVVGLSLDKLVSHASAGALAAAESDLQQAMGVELTQATLRLDSELDSDKLDVVDKRYESAGHTVRFRLHTFPRQNDEQRLATLQLDIEAAQTSVLSVYFWGARPEFHVGAPVPWQTETGEQVNVFAWCVFELDGRLRQVTVEVPEPQDGDSQAVANPYVAGSQEAETLVRRVAGRTVAACGLDVNASLHACLALVGEQRVARMASELLKPLR